jgi:hypothetical protein
MINEGTQFIAGVRVRLRPPERLIDVQQKMYAALAMAKIVARNPAE